MVVLVGLTCLVRMPVDLFPTINLPQVVVVTSYTGMPPEQVEYLAEAQAGLMLVELVNEGFLVEDGEVYRAALRYTDAAMTLNDKPLPLLQR